MSKINCLLKFIFEPHCIKCLAIVKEPFLFPKICCLVYSCLQIILLYCSGVLDRADELNIQEDTPYSLEDIVGLCNAVCAERQIDPANVDILLFSCRARLGKPQEVVPVHPKLVVKI